ncbi:hypothetical protein RRG08_044437 [Elysia crispata]|uniref:Uncharacterized protein n=1 Tax=Elysia crispata TaxID=231223 RepID=A0AAE1AIR2_9GAST|nr:hypothetical protein RRG08_044437 [Elysia crispata]
MRDASDGSSSEDPDTGSFFYFVASPQRTDQGLGAIKLGSCNLTPSRMDGCAPGRSRSAWESTPISGQGCEEMKLQAPPGLWHLPAFVVVIHSVMGRTVSPVSICSHLAPIFHHHCAIRDMFLPAAPLVGVSSDTFLP